MRLLGVVLLLMFVWAILAVLIACLVAPPVNDATESAESPEHQVVICVVNYPLKYFANRIAGHRALVEFPAPRNVDPAHWEPDQEAIWSFQEADLVLLNGADYAEWIAEAMLLEEKICTTSEHFEQQYLATEVVGESDGGKKVPARRAKWDGHTWLDPQLAIIQARAVQQALTRLAPEFGDEFDHNSKALERDLRELDEKIKQMSSNYIDQPLLAAQPVYAYLARRCGWNMKCLDWKPDETPGDRQWQVLGELLDVHPAKWMLWMSPPKRETADRLKLLGIECVVFDICANVPEQGDYLTVMHKNVERLRPIFRTL